ncbi:MAG: hypothetical protein SF053_10470, partial [Bacteroidia bacterium]|nr:hypothetical protein [Bacteroidia bacterium]
MKPHYLLLWTWLLMVRLAAAQSETEPNNTLPTANLIQEGAVITGSLNSATDANDYFKSLPADDGTVKLYFTFSGGTTGSDMTALVYNKAGSQIGVKSIFNVTGGSDSVVVHCRLRDTVYFQLNCSGLYTYQLSYQTEPSGTNDVAPNDNFATATFFAQTDTAYGRVGYSSVAIDAEDYYLSVLPVDGTLRYFIEYNNTSGSTGADLTSYIYNKNQVQIGGSNQFNRPLGPGSDSITVFGRAADTVYFR